MSASSTPSTRPARSIPARATVLRHKTIGDELQWNDRYVPVPPEAEHITPLLEALQASGNHPVGNWFVPNQGGWDCEMRGPLDLGLLRPLIDLDPHRSQIVVREDELTCLRCWVSIRGPGTPER